MYIAYFRHVLFVATATVAAAYPLCIVAFRAADAIGLGR